MANSRILDIYGSEASFVSGHKLTIPVSEEMYFNLNRLDLTHCERHIVEFVMACRYSVSRRPIPSIRKMAAELGMSYTHAKRCVKRLEELGLQVKRKSGRRALLFVRGLFLKLRRLIDTRQTVERPKKERAAPPAPPIPAPAPDPEPEPLPPAAESAPVLATEWQWIKQAAQEKVSKGARHWFEGTRGYRLDQCFVVVSTDRTTIRLLSQAYNSLISSLVARYCPWAQSVSYVVERGA